MTKDRNPFGNPKPIVKKDYEYQYYCGGMGGGGCYDDLGFDRVTWAVENDPFSVLNKLLVLFDTGLYQFFTDAGPTGTPPFNCDHSPGDLRPFWVAVSVDGNPTVDEIKAQNVQGGLQGFNVDAFYEFDEKLLPQPTDPAYDGNTYVTVYWGDSSYVTAFGLTTDTRLFTTELNLHDVRI